MASDTDTSRYVLTNRTNIDLEGDASIGHPGLSNDRKEPVRELCQVSRKRRHHQISQDAPALSESSDEDDDITFHHTRLSLKDRSAFGGYGFTQRWRASATVSTARPECEWLLTRNRPKSEYGCSVSTRSMLRTFVSSDKADVFKCYSCETDSFVTLPYACAFSHDAKRGGTPLLAVATEQGVVHILNTARRRDWDVGMCSLCSAYTAERPNNSITQNLKGRHSNRTRTEYSMCNGHKMTRSLRPPLEGKVPKCPRFSPQVFESSIIFKAIQAR